MAVKNMTRVRKSEKDAGGLYIDKVTVPSAGESDIYLLPFEPIVGDIGLELLGAGTGTIQFTLCSPDEITAGTATYTAWDASSRINPAVTAWKVVSASGEKIGRVVVKTSLA